MKLFGTDGIRGRAGAYPVDPATMFRLGRALGAILHEGSREPSAVIGGDTRASTPGIVAAVCSGLSAAGIRVENAGVVPTPAVARLAVARGAGAGIAVSASHNPWTDNGVKIFGPTGRKCSDAIEERLEAELASPAEAAEPVPAASPEADASLADLYVASVVRDAARLDGLRVALDCANGAASRVGPAAFRGAGASVRARATEPDGRNINDGCGALHPEALAAWVRAGGFDMGAAFDGDADRAILCDESGRVLDGDDVLWILARAWKRAGALDPPIVVATVMSNFGLEAELAREGITLLRTPVGDRHVAARMAETGAILGGEASGHVLAGPAATTGDGILTALTVAGLLRASGRPLTALADLARTPQALRNVRVARRVPLDELAALAGEIGRAEAQLAGRGRVLLRYSGTEPLLRILVEGVDAPEVEAVASRLEGAAARELSEKSA